jgi:mono/diheme cytochrome c family protein
MIKQFGIILSLAGVILLPSCSSEEKQPVIETTRSEGIEYAPQMYHSLPYEPYTQLEQNAFNKKGKNVRHPVDGTIARGTRNGGWPYGQYSANAAERWAENYEKSAEDLQMPDTLPANQYTLAQGKQLYTTYCDHCHGAKGEGGGPVMSEGKIGAVSYKDKARINLPHGKMFYSITYGKGAMGSHASVLTPEERWLLVRYVRLLQGRKPEAKIDPASMEEIKFMTLSEMVDYGSAKDGEAGEKGTGADKKNSEEDAGNTTEEAAKQANVEAKSDQRQASSTMPR